MKNIIRLLILLSVILTAPLSAQYALTNLFPLGQQLPSSSIRCIYQDKDGIIWLGTSDGLCRYDGYNIHVYRSNPKSPNLLSNNDIRCIAEDSNGHLLIGTWKGINILDLNTNKISSLDFPVFNTEIKSIAVDKKGYVWIGTYERLVRCSSDFKECKTYDGDLPITSVNSIFQDEKGNLWSLFWQKGLYKYNSQKDKWVVMPKIGKNNNPFRMFQDKSGQLWITSWDDGIYQIHPERQSQNTYTLVSTDNTNDNNRFAAIFAIVQDNQYGYFWMVGHQGLTVAEYKDAKFDIIDMNNVTSKMNNIFSSIHKDIGGNIWITAFNEGAYIINLDNPVIKNYPFSMIKAQTGGLTTDIKAIYEDKDGDLWISQNRYGLGIYSHRDNTLRFFNEFPSLKNLNEISSIVYINSFSSDPDVIWACSEYSSLIYVIRKSENKLVLDKTYNLEKLGGGYIQQILEDNNKVLWIITSNGVFCKPYGKEIQATNIPIKEASGIAMDIKGDFWISTRTQGIFKFTPIQSEGNWIAHNLINLNKNNSNILSNDIECISTDTTKSKIWIGSKEGNIFTINTSDLQIQDISHEFYGYINEGIQNIVIDTINHVWISTNKRIIEYNPVNKGKIAYTVDDNINVNSLFQNSYYYAKGKYIYYGGNKGITRLSNSTRLAEKAKKIQTLITDVIINDNSILDGILSNEYSLNRKDKVLRLGNDAKNIKIEFSALNYSSPHKILYAYKIKDIDDEWIYTNGDRQFAFYNKLPKGSHMLEIKATDANGLWSDTISTYTIVKEPTWSETWWAYTIYILVSIGIIYLIYSKTQRQIILKNELRIIQIEKEKADELSQAKLSYFTNISHDFLTPITIIACLLDDIETLYLNKIPQLNNMRFNLNKLKRLIQQILDFRKIENGNLKLKVSLGNISDFIEELCESNFKPLMNKKRINFLFIKDSDSIYAYFDADKIEKVIFNLLSNAYKYTHEGGSITVTLNQIKKEEYHYIIIRISDTGVGVEPNNLKQIFNRFFSYSTEKGMDGNGIGLALTKELLQLHHATIDVESEINKGTIFSVCLPIDQKSYSESEIESAYQAPVINESYLNLIKEASLRLPENPQLPENTDNNKMLIVEDNDELLKLMYNIFSRRRRVMVASNGIEALTIIKDNDIDIVVSDVMMPEMDGLTLCLNLKSDLKTSHIPIILLTAKNNPDDRVACYNAGADAYIAKPFELKVLEARIQNFLSNRQIKQREFKLDSNIDTDRLETSAIDQQFLSQAISIIQDHLLDTDFEINNLAQALCISKSSLYRKIKVITGLSPIEFIRNIRLKHACKMLRDNSINISEVAYSCGFSNPRYFSSCFKEEFGVTPKIYQKSLHNK